MNRELVKILQKGGIGVMPTDTIYGLVGSALKRKTVERIYKARKRDRSKPFIVLISSLGNLRKFGIKLSREHLRILNRLWPGAVSVIFPCPNKKFSYLHRGKNSIAFRLPKDKWLRRTLEKTGPLVAPSANIAGRPPAKTVTEARKYFGGEIDFYFGAGRKKKSPSTIVELRR